MLGSILAQEDASDGQSMANSHPDDGLHTLGSPLPGDPPVNYCRECQSQFRVLPGRPVSGPSVQAQAQGSEVQVGRLRNALPPLLPLPIRGSPARRLPPSLQPSIPSFIHPSHCISALLVGESAWWSFSRSSHAAAKAFCLKTEQSRTSAELQRRMATAVTALRHLYIYMSARC
jgi:hypothetical protein